MTEFQSVFNVLPAAALLPVSIYYNVRGFYSIGFIIPELQYIYFGDGKDSTKNDSRDKFSISNFQYTFILALESKYQNRTNY